MYNLDSLRLNDRDYLEMRGLNVMLAHDFYPEGHQGGIGFIQNGLRVATNGDIRLEPTPGQWSPTPKVGERTIDRDTGTISVRMEFPDASKNRRGFNPIEYPDLDFAYCVRVTPEGRSFRMGVDLDAPLPEDWIGKVGFNLELFPGVLFGKSFATEHGFGIFPRQANGPGSLDANGAYRISPLGAGRTLTIAPECEKQRLTVEALRGGPIEILDGRGLHNNGWFVLRSLVESGSTLSAIEWLVTPDALPGWTAPPVIQVSQVGYLPCQQKVAIIERDPHDEARPDARLLKIDARRGLIEVRSSSPRDWGSFLRSDYCVFDFSEVVDPGMYLVEFGSLRSNPFEISPAVFDRGVWQPTVDTFLPVQMCHMRVSENYRVWHGACHLDDARMAPTGHNHFDGYIQGDSTLTRFSSGEHVPGLNRGGWHDAGDYDLRVESQAQTVHGLALAYEEFGLDYDDTTVDQETLSVELRRPDGKPDVLQQVEHGAISIVGAYRALGRLYRGIIEPTLRQYTHLGDAATQTDNLTYDCAGTIPPDDRWVFTEENPRREASVGAALACAARVLSGFNEELAAECRVVAEELFERLAHGDSLCLAELALELLMLTGEHKYERCLLDAADRIASDAWNMGWIGARASVVLDSVDFKSKVLDSLLAHRSEVEAAARKTPYGVPYEPHIWGAGWVIQRFGFNQYWLHSRVPNIFPSDYMLNAISFVHGCHPGPNTASFVSGVGACSLIPGYGVNRADESFIPGGVASGTALIRPDFPELLEWPYLWQQTEYCGGNPTSDYVFLVAAASHLARKPADILVSG